MGERGQSLFNAYNDLRKRLMDVRREISVIGRRNHDAEQTIKRLRVEMEDWTGKQIRLNAKLDELTTENRNLKSSLLEAERYRGEYREVAEILALLKRKKNKVAAEIKKTKEDLQKARMEGAMPKAKKYA